MEYILSVRATESLEIVKRTLSRTGRHQSGFIIGSFFGRLPVIDQLVPADIDMTEIDQILDEYLAVYQEKLIGLYFTDEDQIESPVLNNLLILKISETDVYAFKESS